MTELSDGRGILYPTRLPTFTRSPAPDDLSDRIRWFWIPQWRLAPGRSSRQEVLPFPASNLVVEPDGVALSGPTTGASHRDLRGSGWAVGALLRPAGIASLCADPSSIANAEVPFDAPELHRAVSSLMAPDETVDLRGAIDAFANWARDHLNLPDESGLLANTMEDLVATDPSIIRVEQVAERLHLSTRGVQRLAQRYVGLPPLAMIRRYRLQEAAKRLREDPSLTIARVAADLGYSDHAHLTGDFTRVLGFTPSTYRSDSASGS
jgi:AraC-like DNA-binding protein